MNPINIFPHRESNVVHLNRVHVQWFALSIFLLFLMQEATSCDSGGPTITIKNNTQFPVRVIVAQSRSQTVSPSPGESSEVTGEEDNGVYTVTAIPDAQWLDYAKTKRKVLNDELANSQNLSGQQLLQVVNDLKEIAAQMQAFGRVGAGAVCVGDYTKTESHNGVVQISQASDGSLVAACK